MGVLVSVSGRHGFAGILRSPGFKFFTIGALVFLLMVPLIFVYLLVEERTQRSAEVQNQIASEWGGRQIVRGPYLVVPYAVKVKTVQKDETVETLQEQRAIFLPEDLLVNGESRTETRKRSIFDITVYSAALTLEGRFTAPDIAKLDPNAVSVRWRDAILAVAVSDVSGLREAASVTLDGGRSAAFEPSMGYSSMLTGIHARIGDALAEAGALDAFAFKFSMAFNGSQQLDFAPVARDTRVRLTSDWRHPSFSGAFLPAERSIGDNGFTAEWRVPHLARSVPQAWTEFAVPGTGDRFERYLFGVRFFIPLDHYSLVTRAAKYGFMFLAVAFGAIFVLELRSSVRVHAVQYIFVGLAMIFFYVLLLSLSEHIGFANGYLAAAGATGLMLSVYAGKIMRSAAKGMIMMGVFLLLYGLLYLILRLEDYALLAGAIVGFLLLTTAMFVTLNINWSGGDDPAYDKA